MAKTDAEYRTARFSAVCKSLWMISPAHVGKKTYLRPIQHAVGTLRPPLRSGY